MRCSLPHHQKGQARSNMYSNALFICSDIKYALLKSKHTCGVDTLKTHPLEPVYQYTSPTSPAMGSWCTWKTQRTTHGFAEHGVAVQLPTDGLTFKRHKR